MRAVAIGEDRALTPTELPDRPLQPHEARVEVAFCGICGSDIHFRGSEAVPAGTVMGHELSGTLREAGERVEGFAPGDRVAVYPFKPCGECPSCLRGDDHICQQAALTGLGLGANPGGYADSVVVDGAMLVPIPDELSFEHGALVEPLAVALHGIAVGFQPRKAGPGARCVVIGAGPIGVMTAFGLQARGIEDVVVVERNERRQERIRTLGFEALGLDGVHDSMLARFGGEAPDVVFECAGNPAAPELAIELVRSGGVVVLLGVLEEPVEISQLVLMIKEAQVRASFAYRRPEFQEAVELLAAGRLPADRLITARAPLEDAQAMFERLEDPRTDDIKILLAPGAGPRDSSNSL
jgi:(R,R)-butanediol dehydrogenase / meso-butanediol dehydrogenase / diacetyl reductase